MSVSLSSDAVSAILDDSTSFYRVHLNNTVLFDAKGITSLSRKMAVLKPCALPESPKFHSMAESSWRPRVVHLAMSLGVEPSFVTSVDQAKKDLREPEIELFAESDLEISPASSLESRRKVVERTPPRDPEPVRKRLRLGEKRPNPVSPVTRHPESSSASSLPSSVLPEPSMTALPESSSPFHQDDLSALPVLGPLPAGSLNVHKNSQPALPSMPSLSAAVPVVHFSSPPVSQPTKFTPDPPAIPTGSIVQRAKSLLGHGCMPLLPPARRQWTREGMVTLTSGQVTIAWPPKGFQLMSKDRKLLEFEFAALSLKRSKDTGSDFDRARLLDEFNFLALPGSLDLSPQKANNPPAKSRFYLYQMVRSVARGLSNSSSDQEVISFLEAAEGKRNKCWDSLINEIDRIDVPLRLAD